MCELLGMSSAAPAAVTCGLDQLALHSDVGPHRDGWGVAYCGDDTHVFRGVASAVDDPQARALARQELRSRLVVAHIRHATQGEVALRNTQPFARNVGGRTHVFAHNGDLRGIEGILESSRGDCRVQGETDSERAFCALLQRVLPLWAGAHAPPPLAERFARLSELAAILRKLGPANFVYTDGDALFAHGHRRKQASDGAIRPPGLHVLSRPCAEEGDDFRTAGLQVSGAAQCTVIAASVPLTDEPWEPLEDGELIAARGGAVVIRGR